MRVARWRWASRALLECRHQLGQYHRKVVAELWRNPGKRQDARRSHIDLSRQRTVQDLVSRHDPIQ
jgi:hypothetical protein